jgi:3-oxosteroid 1-dehydrogenase
MSGADTQAFDVVVVGSGAAGLFCAIAARKLGLAAIVMEKDSKFGGGSAISAGMLWVGANHLNARANESPDSPDEVATYLRYVGADGLDPRRMQVFVDEAPQALKFFEDLGLPFRLTNLPDHYYGVTDGGKMRGRVVDLPPISANALGSYRDDVVLPAGKLYRIGGSQVQALGGPNSLEAWNAACDAERESPDMRGAGAGLISWLIKLAIESGVVLRSNAGVARLQVENGRIVGVVTSRGNEIKATQGVVLATGGYESNPDLVRIYDPLPGWQSMFPESLTGDGLIIATEHGAAIATISNNLSIFLGFRNPDEAPGGTALCRLSGIQELIAPHTVVVNRAGHRFADETFFQAVAPILRAFDPKTRVLPNLPAFLIFDQQYVASHSFAGRRPGDAIPSWVPRADNLADLADELGIDAEAFAATVARFNADAADGRDSQFSRGETPWGQSRFNARQTLGTIAMPPFYGIELHPTALCSAGLHTDTTGRVINVRDQPMPGLFAIGNAAARKETGSGYQTGFSLGSAMTFGLIAARNLAKTKTGDEGEGVI